MALDPKSRSRFNLTETVVLLLDPTAMGLAILSQIITGLGARRPYKCTTAAEAKEIMTHFQVDLVIVDGVAESGEGYEFVRWLRQEVPPPNQHTPVLLTAGHTMVSDVAKARNCGAHFIVTKPIAPITLLERIIWVAKEGRAFLTSDGYVGPDRRHSGEGRKGGLPGRRREDKQAEAQRLAAEAESTGGPETDVPATPLRSAAS